MNTPTPRTIGFTCSIHGHQLFKAFCFGGIELACGCQFLKVNGRELEYFAVPPWQKPKPEKKPV